MSTAMLLGLVEEVEAAKLPAFRELAALMLCSAVVFMTERGEADAAHSLERLIHDEFLS